MRRNRRNSMKKERIVMIASSVFVLTALTMTGIYLNQNNQESKDDGYTLDFTALEDSVDQKFQEIADNQILNEEADKILDNILEDDLDYMPMDMDGLSMDAAGAGSGVMNIPAGTSSGAQGEEEHESTNAGEEVKAEDEKEEDSREENTAQANAANVSAVTKELHFSEENGLTRPVEGEVLMHYSTESRILFRTLQNYKYNPAVIFSAAEGAPVSACAEGRVVSIYDDAEIGHVLTLDLGDGYVAVYGQLKDIPVAVNSYVSAGENIGAVAAPTKYYSAEGCNLYFRLTRDEENVNPENLF